MVARVGRTRFRAASITALVLSGALAAPLHASEGRPLEDCSVDPTWGELRLPFAELRPAESLDPKRLDTAFAAEPTALAAMRRGD